MNLPSKEDARLCATVVKHVALAKGVTKDPAFMGRLTATVAGLFSKGIRDRDRLLSETMAIADMSVTREVRGSLPVETYETIPGTIDSSMEPENERGHQDQ